jgi:hypothetical protein
MDCLVGRGATLPPIEWGRQIGPLEVSFERSTLGRRQYRDRAGNAELLEIVGDPALLNQRRRDVGQLLHD